MSKARHIAVALALAVPCAVGIALGLMVFALGVCIEAAAGEAK